jgi:uncharacterized protein
MAVLLAVPFGLAIGVLLGLVGGGGSILAVPVFIYILGEPVKDATTASLLVVALSAGFAAVSHRRRGCTDLRVAGVFAGASAVGAIVGTALNRGSSPTAIVVILAIVMLVAAAAMLRQGRNAARAPQPPVGRAFWLRLIPAALLVGVLTGYVGVGGGFLIVPVLTIVLGFGLDRAIGTSLVIITLTSAVALAAHLQSGPINWSAAVPFAGAAIVGSLIGAYSSARTSRRRLTQFFSGLVIVVACALIATTVIDRM